MGWQDAPLASPTGPAPAWSSAPLATQSHAPAGGAAPADPRDDGPSVGGFLSRVRARVQQSVGSLAGGIDQVVGDTAGALGFDGIKQWTQRDQAGADQHVQQAQDVLAKTPQVSTTAHPILGRIANAGEAALGMVPDVALAINPVGLLAYGVGTEGDTARRRAFNDGRTDPGIMDYLAAAPSSAANVALQRFGVGGEGASLLQRVGREGAAQAGISGADYVGTTAGTETPFSFSDLGAQAAEGGQAGLLLGGAMHGGAAALRRYGQRNRPQPMPDEPLSEGSLNDGPAWASAPVVEDVLRSVGSDPGHFTSPAKAEAAALRVQERRAPPPPPSALPGDIVDYFTSKGLSEGQARGIAAGIVAESRGDHSAVNPTSGALGLGQWLGPRKAALTARYGENPTRQQQLDFLFHELTGGDAGGKHVLSQSEPGAVLNAYIRKFMRPGAGRETEGDLARGLAALGERADERIYRAPPPRDDPFHVDSGFERTDRPEEPLRREGVGESRTATGDSSRPFMEGVDDPEGQPGFWERRAEMHAEDLRKEWEASRQDTGRASDDPSQRFGRNGYGQRPHMPDAATSWAMTDGHIADKDGKPVAFRNAREAAKFAAKNKLGGDFEPVAWAANSERVTLRRRPGSTYGERPARPEGPTEPPAGRSADTSQRMIPDWQKAPTVAESKAAPFAERGSVSDQTVPRETENLPAGPERFDQVPPIGEGDLYAGGTFERARPDADYGGKEPPKPRNFLDHVVGNLSARSKTSGMRHRISAEDAIDNGVDADAIYQDANAKYPTVKVHLQRVFSSSKAPLKSRAQPTKLHTLDDLGDRFDPEDFGITHGERPSPEEIGRLLNDAIHGHEEALNRSDPNYEARNEWIRRHNAAREFESRYGERWAHMSDEELARIDALEGEDARFDDILNHVLGDEAPKETGDERPFAREADDGRPAAEGEAGGGRSERDTGEEGGREAPASDALFPERDTDQRDALQRRADAGLKPDAEQKPAGSDGGLFDTQDTTGDLYGDKNTLFTREAKERAGKTIKDAANRANSGVDPKVVGAFATEAGYHAEASARKLADMVLEPDADPGEIIRAAKKLAEDPKKTATGLLKSLDRFGSAVAYSSDGALRTLARHYNSPAIVKLADMFQARAGAADSTAETYDGALKRNNGKFRSRLDEALDPFIGKKDSMERIRDLLADPNGKLRSTEKERAAAREIRDLLKDVIDYRKEAGEDIGEVKDYFPRVVDALAVANEPGKFKAAAEKLYKELGVDDPAAAADAWMTRILDTHAGIDGGEEFVVKSGKPSSSKSREFGPAADRLLRDFMQKDPLLVLSDYVTGSVRRAEQTRRFGAKGAVNSPERAAWMKEHGDKTQWDVMVDDIRKELRASGEDADGVIRQIKAIRDGNMGRLGTAGVRLSRAVSTIHAWNQLSTLQKVTLSSIGDTAMGFVAGKGGMSQGVRHFVGSLKETARLIETLGKKDRSDAFRWAEAAGIVGHSTASQLIQARMDAAPGAVQHASLLNKFYHKVGIEQLTSGGRVQAAENGKMFVNTLADDLLSQSGRTRTRAEFYLRELGIKDPHAFAEWVRNNGAPDRSSVQRAKEGSREAEYAAAVVRFADQTVLMPSRAMKPVWANHPLGSLIFALQSYNAAFTQQVLKRTGRLAIEGVKSKDPAHLVPAVGLTALVGMTALQDYLRTAIFGGGQKDESDTQYGMRILDRAGLTGMASPFLNALYGLKYRRSISQSLQGSVVGRAGQAADAVGSLFIGNSDKTNTAERKAAGLLYDLVIDPAVNAAGAKYLRGAAGTAAIMGTGSKAGGVLPGDRDAFVDAVAGPRKRTKGG